MLSGMSGWDLSIILMLVTLLFYHIDWWLSSSVFTISGVFILLSISKMAQFFIVHSFYINITTDCFVCIVHGPNIIHFIVSLHL